MSASSSSASPARSCMIQPAMCWHAEESDMFYTSNLLQTCCTALFRCFYSFPSANFHPDDTNIRLKHELYRKWSLVGTSSREWYPFTMSHDSVTFFDPKFWRKIFWSCLNFCFRQYDLLWFTDIYCMSKTNNKKSDLRTGANHWSPHPILSSALRAAKWVMGWSKATWEQLQGVDGVPKWYTEQLQHFSWVI